MQYLSVELREVHDQGRRGLALAVREAAQLGGELGVIEVRRMRDHHDC